MPADIGRITGIMLKDNLDRLGVDLSFETDLIYLDVTNNRVGIKNSSAGDDLTIEGTIRTTNLISDVSLSNGNLEINSNEISTILGSLNLTAADAISATAIQTDNLSIDDNIISTYTNNTNIELRPLGTGIVRVFNDFNVTGDIEVTGNVTFDGNIIFGDASTDSVTINADVVGNIVPDVTSPATVSNYSLGVSGTTRWSEFRTVLYNGAEITTDSLNTSEGINLALRPGKTWFVATNGLDTNEGDHENGGFATLGQALSVAQAGDTVYIYPGTYIETFPLTIPVGVAVRGAGIRAVSIKPTVLTQTQNAFLLNGETSVKDLTVKDFYSPGYAFSFAPGITVTTRSPYIQDITVITKGSVITSGDPQGYDSADAGKGALVDGSLANVLSREASMLFNAVTFITPGVDGLTLTNGVRVEWLNSFTYYAKRGLYLTSGTLGFASQATRFGGELRSIGSANVYGEFGAVADGLDTLAYLVGHNFAYIGTKGNSENDYGLVSQSDEVVQINSGKIYYDSVDHKGDYRIGDIFYVNQETGQVSFNAQAINFGASGSITLEGPDGRTLIQAADVQVDNIRIHGNNIDSLAGEINFSAISGTTTLNTNVTVTGDLDVTENTLVKGNVFLGDTPFDTVTVFPRLTQTLEPDETDLYSLGNITDPKVWDTAFLKGLDVDAVIDIRNNTITTLTEDTNLEFGAAGTGIINVTTTDVQIDNSLTVNTTLTVDGDTALKNVVTSDLIEVTGNIIQTGNFYIEGTLSGNDVTLTSPTATFDVTSIKIENNIISATALDDDLVFTALDSGSVIIDQGIIITDSEIGSYSTIDTDVNLIVTPNGTGQLDVNSTKSLKLPLGNDTTKVLGSIGEVRYNTTSGLIESYAPSGNINWINLYSSSRSAYISPELTLGSADNTLRFATDGVVQATITPTTLSTTTLQSGNISITGNTIVSVDDGDIALQPTGTGQVNIYSTDIGFNGTTLTNFTNSALTFTNTNNGYVRLSGNTGFVIPVGTDPDIGGSLFFDQTTPGKYVGISLGFNLNLDAYSAEAWFYMTAGTSGAIFGSTTANGFCLKINSLVGPNNVQITTIAGQTNNYTFPTILLNTWYHIVATRDSSGNETVFLNGSRALTQTNTAISYATATNQIGAHNSNTYFSGYLTNIRVLQGITDYNPLETTIAVPISPVKNNDFARVVLLASSEEFFIIDSSQQQEVTNYGTVYNSLTPFTNNQPDNPELGTTRYNINKQYVEVFNGTLWIPVYGSSSTVTVEEVSDIMDVWGLVLG